MNKGMGMDGFQDIMPMGDDDNLITVDDLNDSLSPESLLNEQMKDIMIFDDLEIPPPEASSMAIPAQMHLSGAEGDLSLEAESAAKFDEFLSVLVVDWETVALDIFLVNFNSQPFQICSDAVVEFQGGFFHFRVGIFEP